MRSSRLAYSPSPISAEDFRNVTFIALRHRRRWSCGITVWPSPAPPNRNLHSFKTVQHLKNPSYQKIIDFGPASLRYSHFRNLGSCPLENWSRRPRDFRISQNPEPGNQIPARTGSPGYGRVAESVRNQPKVPQG